MKRVIITGTTGFIGGYLRDFLVHEGYKVIAFQRKSQQDEARVEYHCFNLAGDIPEEPFERADYLIHCAYQPHSLKDQDAIDINRVGTEKLQELCAKHNVHFIFFSTMSAHEQAESHYGKSNLELEATFNMEKDLVLRMGLILGNGGLFQNMSDVIRKAKIIPLVGAGKQPLQTLAIEDLAKVIVKAIEQDATGKLTLAHPDVILMKDFYKALAKKHGVHPKFIPVPLLPVMLACRTAEMLRIDLPITSENVLGLKHLRAEPSEPEVYGIQLKNFQQALDAL